MKILSNKHYHINGTITLDTIKKKIGKFHFFQFYNGKIYLILFSTYRCFFAWFFVFLEKIPLNNLLSVQLLRVQSLSPFRSKWTRLCWSHSIKRSSAADARTVYLCLFVCLCARWCSVGSEQYDTAERMHSACASALCLLMLIRHASVSDNKLRSYWRINTWTNHSHSLNIRRAQSLLLNRKWYKVYRISHAWKMDSA